MSAARGTKRSGSVKHPAPKRGASPQVGYSTRPRIDKLGVKPGARVALIDADDAAFLRELRERTTDIAIGRPKAATAMILFRIDGPKPLARLTALQKTILRDGAIWMLWPKGRKEITEDMIRDAALAQGLVDVKVMAFSEILSGLKLVIPLARR
ncbi:MAG: DUF3052 family protein [Candidatus Eisenbacteria bacterium]|nr:DUF3052 family protein [Candidatus Eisenbacteria bacterium]